MNMKGFECVLSIFPIICSSISGAPNASVGRQPDGLRGENIVFHQICNAGLPGEVQNVLKKEIDILKEEISLLRSDLNNTEELLDVLNLLKDELKSLKKELLQQLKKTHTEGNSTAFSELKKQVAALRNELNHLERKDPWHKLNIYPLCFGARDDQFGKFVVPTSGNLTAVKLVHLYGYVSCDTADNSYWSHWGCGAHSSLSNHVNVVITSSTNHVLLPPSQFIEHSTKWSLIPGYSSVSPEIVLSEITQPIPVSSGDELRLWYGEDLVDKSEADNGGKTCCNLFALFT